MEKRIFELAVKASEIQGSIDEIRYTIEKLNDAINDVLSDYSLAVKGMSDEEEDSFLNDYVGYLKEFEELQKALELIQ